MTDVKMLIFRSLRMAQIPEIESRVQGPQTS
jgi:hypothetical protein